MNRQQHEGLLGTKVERIQALYDAWKNGDEPEGAPSASRTLEQIGQILGDHDPAPRKAAVSLVLRGKPEAGGVDLLVVWNRRYETWLPPGGLVEPGETPEAAQVRELLEETGLPTIRAELLHEGPTPLTKPGRASIVRIYRVWSTVSPVAKEPGCPVQWMPVREFLRECRIGDFYAPVLAIALAGGDR